MFSNDSDIESNGVSLAHSSFKKFMEIHKEAKALFQKMPCPQDIIDRCDDDLSMDAEVCGERR